MIHKIETTQCFCFPSKSTNHKTGSLIRTTRSLDSYHWYGNNNSKVRYVWPAFFQPETWNKGILGHTMHQLIRVLVQFSVKGKLARSGAKISFTKYYIHVNQTIPNSYYVVLKALSCKSQESRPATLLLIEQSLPHRLTRCGRLDPPACDVASVWRRRAAALFLSLLTRSHHLGVLRSSTLQGKKGRGWGG